MPSATSLAWKALLVVAVNSAQLLLVDLARYHGAADPSCCFFVVPVFASMAVVGFFTCDDKSHLKLSHWLSSALLCSIDLAHQILEKGLIYAGSALYLVAASFSTVWTALVSFTLLRKRLTYAQWLGVFCVTAGFCLRVAQVPAARAPEEYMGVALVTVAQILHSLAFVLNEKYMNDPKTPIKGPQLVFMCGVINTVGLLMWTVVWTVPRWEELVTTHRKLRGGSPVIIACCFAALTICSLLRSSVLWVILKHTGAVSTGILKAVRMAVVMVLTHILFCHRQASQCLTPTKALAASVATLGVLIYSVGFAAAAKNDLQQETAKGRELDYSEAQHIVAHGLAQPATDEANPSVKLKS